MRAPTQGGDGSRRCPQWAGRNQPAQCRGAHRHGHGRPHRGAMERGQPRVHAQPAECERRWRRPRRDAKVLRMMLQSGVLAVGAYLVIHGEATAGIIIAGIYSERTRVGSGRSRHRPLEGLRCRPAELASAEPSFVGRSRAIGADAIGRSRSPPGRRNLECRAARCWQNRRPGCGFRARGRARSRHHRPQRFRQIFSGASSGRRLAPRARQRAP